MSVTNREELGEKSIIVMTHPLEEENIDGVQRKLSHWVSIFQKKTWAVRIGYNKI